MKNISTRLAQIADEKFLLELRNDHEAVQYSLEKKAISASEHEEWFSHQLSSEKCFFVIGEIDDETSKFGSVRFSQATGDYWEVSLNISPQFRGRGLSKILLNQATIFFAKHHLGLLLAKIQSDNHRSIRCFQNCGFGLYEKNGTVLTYVNKSLIIDQIEKVRSRNNVNWMNLMRLAFRVSPKEAEKIFTEVNVDDGEISQLLSKLTTQYVDKE